MSADVVRTGVVCENLSGRAPPQLVASVEHRAAPTSLRPRRPAMTTMNSAKLIDLVYTRDPLWNPKSNFYHNREMKHLLWTEIATELGVSRETVRTKWSCLRDSFRRELKKRNDGGFFSKAQWQFFNRMLFLTSAMNSKDCSADHDFYGDVKNEVLEMIANPEISMNSGTTSSELRNSNVDLTSDLDHVSSEEGKTKEEPTTSTQPTSTTTPPTASTMSEFPTRLYSPTKLPKFHPQFNVLANERRKLRRIRKKLKKATNRDGDYHFALSLVSSMQRVPEENKIKMRMLLMNTISSFTGRSADNLGQSTCDNSTTVNEEDSEVEIIQEVTIQDTSSIVKIERD